MEDRCDSLMEVVSKINSKVAIYGSIIEYKSMDLRLSRTKGIFLDVILTSVLSQDKGSDLVQVV